MVLGEICTALPSGDSFQTMLHFHLPTEKLGGKAEYLIKDKEPEDTDICTLDL